MTKSASALAFAAVSKAPARSCSPFTGSRTKFSANLLPFALDVVDDDDGTGVIALVERCHARDFGKHLVKEFDPLWPKGLRHEAQPRDVPAGPSEARHQSRPHRIGHAHHHDGNRLGGFFGGLCGRCIDGDDRVDLELQKLIRQRGQPLIVSGRIPQLDADVTPFDVAPLLKLVAERFEQARLKVLRRDADTVTLLLLRASRKRPSRCY